MKVTTLEKPEPGTVPPRISLATLYRRQMMLMALSSNRLGEGLTALPEACNAEIISLAGEVASRYAQLVDAGLRNGKSGYSDDQVIAYTREAYLKFHSGVVSQITDMMEVHLAAGRSKETMAACYDGAVCALLMLTDSVRINLVSTKPDGSQAMRTIESRRVVVQ